MKRPRWRVGGNMYLFTLREQRETRQSIGILATDECAHAADVGLLGSQIRRVTIGPSELFGPRGDELAMAVQQPTIAIEQKVGVPKGSHADRTLFGDTYREEYIVAFGDLAEPLCVRARHLNGVVKQPTEESVLVHRSIDQVPHWEGGNERLPKNDQVSTGIGGLLNEPVQLIDGSVTVEKHRSRLHCCCAELRIDIAWHNDLRRLTNIYVHGFRTRPSPHQQQKTAQCKNHDSGVSVGYSELFQAEH